MANANPFEKAEKKEKRVKIILFGPPGSGKTRLALQFPNPVVIDMERGTDLYGKEFNFSVKQTTDVDKVMAMVDWLLVNEHDYKTLVIDPVTIYWSAVQQKWAEIFLVRERTSKGNKIDYYKLQAADWGIVKGEVKQLLRKIYKLDMNVVCTAHQKDEYSKTEMMKIVGPTADMEKNFGHDFDVTLRLWRDDNRKFMATVHQVKDRTNKFPHGDFELNYQMVIDSFGADTLEREAVPIEFATPEQVDRIDNYRVMFTIEDKKMKAWLSDYDATTIEELTKESADEMLEILKKQEERKRDGDPEGN